MCVRMKHKRVFMAFMNKRKIIFHFLSEGKTMAEKNWRWRKKTHNIETVTCPSIHDWWSFQVNCFIFCSFPWLNGKNSNHYKRNFLGFLHWLKRKTQKQKRKWTDKRIAQSEWVMIKIFNRAHQKFFTVKFYLAHLMNFEVRLTSLLTITCFNFAL